MFIWGVLSLEVSLRDIIIYFDEMIHEMVSLKERCLLIGGVVWDRDHCIHAYSMYIYA